jgi:predicted nuclease of restriction endonuclease-like (RecB) superfamily
MGEEYPVQGGNQDFSIDFVFYNRSLNGIVAIEFKNREI